MDACGHDPKSPDWPAMALTACGVWDFWDPYRSLPFQKLPLSLPCHPEGLAQHGHAIQLKFNPSSTTSCAQPAHQDNNPSLQVRACTLWLIRGLIEHRVASGDAGPPLRLFGSQLQSHAGSTLAQEAVQDANWPAWKVKTLGLLQGPNCQYIISEQKLAGRVRLRSTANFLFKQDMPCIR